MKQKIENILKKKKSLNRKGFSLPETLVAILIFSIVMTMLSGSFASFLKVHIAEKNNQKALEGAQYALNLMEKTIRTSVLSTTNGSTLVFAGADQGKIKLFDNSQSKCLAYLYDSAEMKIKMLTKVTSDVDIDGCGNFSDGYVTTDLTAANIISVAADGKVSSVGDPGKISISLTVKEGNGQPMVVGTTASLRAFDPAPAPVCTAQPANATMCDGDSIGFFLDTSSTVVDSCSSPLGSNPKCEFKCNAGYVKSGNSCVPIIYTCINYPSHASVCPADISGLVANQDAIAVNTCSVPQGSDPKCEYKCDTGYVAVGNSCVLQTFSCTGSIPSNATLCAGDDTGLSTDQSRTSVDSCTAAKCEYACNAGYGLSGGACLENNVYFSGFIERSTGYGSFWYSGNGKNSMTGMRSDYAYAPTEIRYDQALKKFTGGVYAFGVPFEDDCNRFVSYEMLSSDLSIGRVPSHSDNFTLYGDNWTCGSINNTGGGIKIDPVGESISGQIYFTGGSTDVWLTPSGNSINGSGGAWGTINVEFKP
ncbi:MAG: hypothetical protein ACD_56C00110G0017 [uncultured bacterium]|nr:MAG: hypothetical protein ACD_56C00110G0017 [uncultured bacterium]